MIGCVLVSCQNSVGHFVYFLYESNVRIYGIFDKNGNVLRA